MVYEKVSVGVRDSVIVITINLTIITLRREYLNMSFSSLLVSSSDIIEHGVSSP